MLFEELPLYEAIYHVRRELDAPGSDDWIKHRQDEFCHLIQHKLPIGHPFSRAQMIDAWVAYRKSPSNKVELTVQVAQAHGRACFFHLRGLGECSQDVDLDRLVPGSRGGSYSIENCVRACSFHNRQRNDRPLEEYLAPSPGAR